MPQSVSIALSSARRLAAALLAAGMVLGGVSAAAQSAAHKTTPAPKPAPAPSRTVQPYAEGLGEADITAGDDPAVRAAAVAAMGRLNGTAVVVDPNTGRVLTMVNQALALSADYQPCSTTKMAVALAALDQGVVNENTPVKVAPNWSVNLTQALAYSINSYFETLGEKLGFSVVAQYERRLGLGEPAGWDIAGEDPGRVPEAPGPGGVAKLSSFGEGVNISPLQLAAITTAIANGGTLYYLQHPTSPEAVAGFQPRVKRQLPIAALTPEIKDGMLAAVQYGTAKLARLRNEQILGKTGTCSRDGVRFGLFASYLGNPDPKLVVVVILRGDGSDSGPFAAEVAGQIYRSLDQKRYFAALDRRSTALPAMAIPGLRH